MPDTFGKSALLLILAMSAVQTASAVNTIEAEQANAHGIPHPAVIEIGRASWRERV